MLLLRRLGAAVPGGLRESPKPALGIASSRRQIASRVARELQLGDRTLLAETGMLAPLADGAVLMRSGNTAVLVAAVSARTPSSLQDFVPFQVEYREKASAVGRIPKTFHRREMGPSDHEVLASRMIDRALRPLFPAGYLYETQVTASVMAMDRRCLDPEVLSLNGASLALCLSDIPFAGPVGAVRVGLREHGLILNPTYEERETSRLNLVVAGSEDKVLMIEGSAQEISRDDLVKAIHFAQSEVKTLVGFQKSMAEAHGKPKREVRLWHASQELQSAALSVCGKELELIFANFKLEKNERESALHRVKKSAVHRLKEAFEGVADGEITSAVEATETRAMRNCVLTQHVRCDGRGLHDIRPLHMEVGVLPDVVHGSALFQRGKTQAAQRVDSYSSSSGEAAKRFMLHYEFPPYSVNEIGKVGRRGRRDIGHGALAENALAPVLPPEEAFPFAVRVYSEITGSNGSSSMATVCGGSLALMDAGVPITGPVAGVTCGLIALTDGRDSHVCEHRLITDIAGIEDHLGDMDFKLAGSRNGITACQMDLKLPGIPLSLLAEAVDQALRGRDRILDEMERTLGRPREHLKPSVPLMEVVRFNPALRAALMGLGGSHLKHIESSTGVELHVNDADSTVAIFSRSREGLQEAKRKVNSVAGALETDGRAVYVVRVVSPSDMGVHVLFEDYPGREAFLHVSEFGAERAKQPEEAFRVGETLHVRALGYDGRGRLLVTRRDPQQIAGGTSALLYSHLMDDRHDKPGW